MKTITHRLALATWAIIGIFSAAPRDAQADKKFTCQMTGTWVESHDDFKFSAEYIAKDGPDTFRGKYVNPGTAEADVTGNAVAGKWTIIVTYTDAGHKNMVKKLIGKGAKDSVSHLLKIEGTYKTYLGTNDIKKDGQFKLLGTCK